MIWERKSDEPHGSSLYRMKLSIFQLIIFLILGRRFSTTVQNYNNIFRTKRLLNPFYSQRPVGCIIGPWRKRAIQGNPPDWNG